MKALAASTSLKVANPKERRSVDGNVCRDNVLSALRSGENSRSGLVLDSGGHSRCGLTPAVPDVDDGVWHVGEESEGSSSGDDNGSDDRSS